MMDLPRRVNEVIVVEGRYDKNTLSQIVDATIIETNGFGIFSDKEKLKLLRALAQKRGLVVLTDSDGAGFLIRNRIKGAIDPDLVKHAYIPDINGKERRKATASKEGKLGVEGMSADVIISALKAAGISFEAGDTSPENEPVTKADLFELGLSGKKDSAERRHALLKRLDLPEKLSANAFLDVLRVLYTRDELFSLYMDK